MNSIDISVSYLDKNNILWKIVNGEKIGKRAVYMKNLSCLWLSDVDDITQIRSYMCGEHADYNEIILPE